MPAAGDDVDGGTTDDGDAEAAFDVAGGLMVAMVNVETGDETSRGAHATTISNAASAESPVRVDNDP